jgi:hypothetical protein
VNGKYEKSGKAERNSMKAGVGFETRHQISIARAEMRPSLPIHSTLVERRWLALNSIANCPSKDYKEIDARLEPGGTQ